MSFCRVAWLLFYRVIFKESMWYTYFFSNQDPPAYMVNTQWGSYYNIILIFVQSSERGRSLVAICWSSSGHQWESQTATWELITVFPWELREFFVATKTSRKLENKRSQELRGVYFLPKKEECISFIRIHKGQLHFHSFSYGFIDEVPDTIWSSESIEWAGHPRTVPFYVKKPRKWQETLAETQVVLETCFMFISLPRHKFLFGIVFIRLDGVSHCKSTYMLLFHLHKAHNNTTDWRWNPSGQLHRQEALGFFGHQVELLVALLPNQRRSTESTVQPL